MTPEEKAIRERHVENLAWDIGTPDERADVCRSCWTDWPCDTVQALNLLDAERAEVKRLRDELDAPEAHCDEPGCTRPIVAGTPRIAGAINGEYRWTCHDHVPKGWPEARALVEGNDHD